MENKRSLQEIKVDRHMLDNVLIKANSQQRQQILTESYIDMQKLIRLEASLLEFLNALLEGTSPTITET